LKVKKNYLSHKPAVIFLAEPLITFAQVPFLVFFTYFQRK